MGTLIGHVAPGFGFLLIGLWHLYNHIKLHVLNPKSYISPPWFPTSKSKYLELFLIMAGSIASISMELFIGPDKHQPFDSDGTIPSNHLHNFEHSLISLTFFVYAAFAIILDKIHIESQNDLTNLLGSIAFSQQFLLFHLHSADHMGPEGQYHMLLQLVVLVSLVTTLFGIAMPKSFLISFVRSLSIFFQGLWFILMGFMLWTPNLIPKGCFMNLEEGHKVVRCNDHEALHRAKSLVNIQFSWFFILVTIFGMSLYLVLVKVYGGSKVQYFSLGNDEDGYEEENKSSDDVESQKKNMVHNPNSFLHVGKNFSPLDIER
ncbi:PREDICTED: transmembrane protein 45A-like [Lupinus angustifolius]|nr:PREDICTED: transmembrane protein 45A-like [Lupinus angustifolius]